LVDLKLTGIAQRRTRYELKILLIVPAEALEYLRYYWKYSRGTICLRPRLTNHPTTLTVSVVKSQKSNEPPACNIASVDSIVVGKILPV
jgi:hypothetical protein